MAKVTAITGTFTAAGAAPLFCGPQGDFNVSLWGTFAATVQPERSFDGGNTWLPYTYADGSAVSWSAPVSVTLPEPEPGVLWRLNCTAFTSGAVNWRISQ